MVHINEKTKYLAIGALIGIVIGAALLYSTPQLGMIGHGMFGIRPVHGGLPAMGEPPPTDSWRTDCNCLPAQQTGEINPS